MKGVSAKMDLRRTAEEFGWEHLELSALFGVTDLFVRGDVSIKVSYSVDETVRWAEVNRPGFAIELIAEKKRRQRVWEVLTSEDPKIPLTDEEIEAL